MIFAFLATLGVFPFTCRIFKLHNKNLEWNISQKPLYARLRWKSLCIDKVKMQQYTKEHEACDLNVD